MKFLLVYGCAMILAIICALIFGSAMQDMYPEGIVIYPPAQNAAPVTSISLHIGLALGWFFALLCYTVMGLTSWLLVRFSTQALSPYPHPLFAAALTCLGLLALAMYLAG